MKTTKFLLEIRGYSSFQGLLRVSEPQTTGSGFYPVPVGRVATGQVSLSGGHQPLNSDLKRFFVNPADTVRWPVYESLFVTFNLFIYSNPWVPYLGFVLAHRKEILPNRKQPDPQNIHFEIKIRYALGKLTAKRLCKSFHVDLRGHATWNSWISSETKFEHLLCVCTRIIRPILISDCLRYANWLWSHAWPIKKSFGDGAPEQ